MIIQTQLKTEMRKHIYWYFLAFKLKNPSPRLKKTNKRIQWLQITQKLSSRGMASKPEIRMTFTAIISAAA